MRNATSTSPTNTNDATFPRAPEGSPKSKGGFDIRQLVTDKIIAMLEKGANKGGQRWTQAAGRGMPCNGTTGQAYRGVNVLLLWSEAVEHGYSSNQWLTYKQAAGIGAQVRKGEKGTMCVYFEMLKRKGASTGEDGDEAGFFPMCKPFWLFNVAQMDGLPESFNAPAELRSDFTPIEAAEQLIAASGATIHHGFDTAFYSIAKDQICLPDRERFTSPENYYSVAIHELTHWSGAESRLAREFGKRFGTEAYAFEELVAELGSAFLCGHIGFVDATIEGHASYLEVGLIHLQHASHSLWLVGLHVGQKAQPPAVCRVNADAARSRGLAHGQAFAHAPGVGLAHLLCSRTSDCHAFALRESIGQLLQVVATQEFIALAHRSGAGFVAKIPDRVDLTRHSCKHLLVLVFDGAPGRAHLLGGESPLRTRQGEPLAERQGCRGRLRIWRKPKAKRWPDEQEADRRRRCGVSSPLSAKPNTCTEHNGVDPTGISVKVSAKGCGIQPGQ